MSLARTLDGTRLGDLGAGLRARFGHLLHEVAKFGAIGAVAYVIDVGTFNALRSGSLSERPLTAKVISVTVSVVVAWLGNRYWTFRHRRRPAAHHELALFALFNAVGLALAVACLGFSRYVLGLESPLADNVSPGGTVPDWTDHV